MNFALNFLQKTKKRKTKLNFTQFFDDSFFIDSLCSVTSKKENNSFLKHTHQQKEISGTKREFGTRFCCFFTKYSWRHICFEFLFVFYSGRKKIVLVFIYIQKEFREGKICSLLKQRENCSESLQQKTTNCKIPIKFLRRRLLKVRKTF